MLSMLIIGNISDVIKSNKIFHVVVAGNVRIYPHPYVCTDAQFRFGKLIILTLPLFL